MKENFSLTLKEHINSNKLIDELASFLNLHQTTMLAKPINLQDFGLFQITDKSFDPINKPITEIIKESLLNKRKTE